MLSSSPRRSALAIPAVLLAAPFACADVTIQGPPLAPPLAHVCTLTQYGRSRPIDTCSTTLLPLQHIPGFGSSGSPGGGPDPRQRFLDQLQHDALNHWNHATFGSAGELHGTIVVGIYAPHLCDPNHGAIYNAGQDPVEWSRNVRPPAGKAEHCSHGCELQMEYVPDPNNPDNLNGMVLCWIQMATITGDLCGRAALGNPNRRPDQFIDNGRNEENTNPEAFGSDRDQSWLHFYHRPDTWFFDSPEGGCVYPNIVPGTPRGCGYAACPALSHRWGYTFDTYLAAHLPGSNQYVLFDGIEWGFTAECTPLAPSPGAGAGVLCGALIFARSRRRRG